MSECIGWVEHEWTLEVDGGSISVTTPPCGDECEPGVIGLGDYHHYAVMRPLPVSVAMATDCPAYDTDDFGIPQGEKRPMHGYESGSHYIAHGTRCDCSWWPVLVPK